MAFAPGEVFSPTDFMRARRPELFSDSEVRSQQLLSKDTFEYLLNVITSKKQEIEFEHFCRRLAEVEICPNLVVQTGPTGGGDSKVDSETYPVSPMIASRWYIGESEAASKERWAFAFSAKRDWRTKVRSDVLGIVETQREYKRIYFITNQFVKDKTRAQLEDELLKKYGIPVHIMDRSWIVKCVFEHDQQELAIETLHLDLPASRIKELSVRDAQRTKELEETEQRIADTSRYRGVEYQLVEECLEAAVLSRNLERPRTEVDGKFVRAQRLADSVGTIQQRLRVEYQRGWTAYWWYEDYHDLLRSYEAIVPVALASSLSDDVELASNLWQLLASACDAGKLDSSVIELKDKADALKAQLTFVAADPERRNNALWARTNLLMLELRDSMGDPDAAASVLAQLRQVAGQANGLVSYPVMALARLVEAIGDFFADFPEYDALIEDIAEITQERVGRRQAGRLLSARGLQKLRANAVYDAIRFFGRAQLKLALRETRDELAVALFSCGLAYEGAGLLWAARANTLAALHQLNSTFHEEGEMAPNILRAVQKLAWLELQLGRVPHVLQWLEFAMLIASSLGLDEEERTNFIEQRESQDKVLALLFLKASREDLRALGYLPDVLERHQLIFARAALLYALGYEDQLRKEGSVSPEESSKVLLETFTSFVELPAGADLPARPTGLESDRTVMFSRVLGAQVTVTTEEDFDSVRLGERIIAASEALFATSLDTELFPYREELNIDIVRAKTHNGPPTISEKKSAPDTLVIFHSGDFSTGSEKEESWFFSVLVKILTSLVIVSAPDKYLERVFGKESALGRALNFTESAMTIADIFGKEPKERLAAWNNESSPSGYILKRETDWHGGRFVEKPSRPRVIDPKPAQGDIPKELLNSQIKHTERHVASMIDIPLWDEARWRATLFVVPVDENGEPLMALGFRGGAAGERIFQGWRKKVGGYDEEERIRLSIITGIDRENPHAYRVVIGSNFPEAEINDQAKQYTSVSRIQRMDAQTPVNLQRFVDAFRRVGSFVLIPASLSEDLRSSKLSYHLGIRKLTARIVPAWQLGEHDIDCMGVLPDDQPIIPSNQSDAPVLKLLGARRRQKE